MTSHPVALLSLAALAILNAWTMRSLIRSTEEQLALRPPPLSHYTWIEEDIPERLALLDARPRVLIPFEDSVHYGFLPVTSSNASGHPEGGSEPSLAHLEWLYTAASPADDGIIHVGPPDVARGVVVAQGHQTHCLRLMHLALEADASLLDSDADVGPRLHMEHCLSMLKDQALCGADGRLERGDPLGRDFGLERDMGVRECADMDAYYRTMARYWKEWAATTSTRRAMA